MAAWGALPAGVLAWAAAIAVIGGLVRGITGFGAAMVMAPPLALLLGPLTTVPVVLALEAFAAAPMLPAASRMARWRLLGPLVAASVLFVPLGARFLGSVDPYTVRQLIAATVLVFALVLLAGLRWRGRHRLPVSLALGSVSGMMLGATSIGGPPVILYLLAGPDEAATTRANLTLFVAITSAAGLTALGLRGAIGSDTLLVAAIMAPLFTLGVVVGSRGFAHLSDQWFRRLTVILMAVVALYVLTS